MTDKADGCAHSHWLIGRQTQTLDKPSQRPWCNISHHRGNNFHQRERRNGTNVIWAPFLSNRTIEFIALPRPVAHNIQTCRCNCSVSCPEHDWAQLKRQNHHHHVWQYCWSLGLRLQLLFQCIWVDSWHQRLGSTLVGTVGVSCTVTGRELKLQVETEISVCVSALSASWRQEDLQNILGILILIYMEKTDHIFFPHLQAQLLFQPQRCHSPFRNVCECTLFIMKHLHSWCYSIKNKWMHSWLTQLKLSRTQQRPRHLVTNTSFHICRGGKGESWKKTAEAVFVFLKTGWTSGSQQDKAREREAESIGCLGGTRILLTQHYLSQARSANELTTGGSHLNFGLSDKLRNSCNATLRVSVFSPGDLLELEPFNCVQLKAAGWLSQLRQRSGEWASDGGRKLVLLQLFHPRVDDIRAWRGPAPACPPRPLCPPSCLQPQTCFFLSDRCAAPYGIPLTLVLRTLTEHKLGTETADRRRLSKTKAGTCT